MAATGNYISETDLTNWASGASEAEKLVIINRVEQQVEKVTQSVFYSLAFDEKFDGPGKNRMFPNLKAPILTVTSIDVLGTTISSDWYSNDDKSVFLDLDSSSGVLAEKHWLLREYEEQVIFPTGIKNIRIIGTIGIAAVPANIKQACIILAEDINDSTLYTHYIEGSEQLGGWQYSLTKTPGQREVLTGVREADILLRPYTKKRLYISTI